MDANTENETFPSLVFTDFSTVCSLQKSFSLVLEALDYDNDTTETGTVVVGVFIHYCAMVTLTINRLIVE